MHTVLGLKEINKANAFARLYYVRLLMHHTSVAIQPNTIAPRPPPPSPTTSVNVCLAVPDFISLSHVKTPLSLSISLSPGVARTGFSTVPNGPSAAILEY